MSLSDHVSKLRDCFTHQAVQDDVVADIRELESKLGRVAELARQGRETSQFTHARAALDEIIKLSELPR